jgi:hypothetical protein
MDIQIIVIIALSIILIVVSIISLLNLSLLNHYRKYNAFHRHALMHFEMFVKSLTGKSVIEDILKETVECLMRDECDDS